MIFVSPPASLLSPLMAIGGRSCQTVMTALQSGARLSCFVPESIDGDNGGYYDAASQTVYLNITRPPGRLTHVLVHECQHAVNLLTGTVMGESQAVALGKEAYIENFLRDEALAHAAGLIEAHEAGDQQELRSPAMRALFEGMDYRGSGDAAFSAYAEYAMPMLRQGALGYLDKANESFTAHGGQSFQSRYARRDALQSQATTAML